MAGPALLAQLVEHLHGKEGVDGSSPSEGSKGKGNGCKASSSVVWISSAEHLSSAFQATIGVASACAKCFQIDLLPGATEHLLGTEGLDEPCSERLPANGSVSRLIIVWSSRTIDERSMEPRRSPAR